MALWSPPVLPSNFFSISFAHAAPHDVHNVASYTTIHLRGSENATIQQSSNQQHALRMWNRDGPRKFKIQREWPAVQATFTLANTNTPSALRTHIMFAHLPYNFCLSSFFFLLFRTLFFCFVSKTKATGKKKCAKESVRCGRDQNVCKYICNLQRQQTEWAFRRRIERTKAVTMRSGRCVSAFASTIWINRCDMAWAKHDEGRRNKNKNNNEQHETQQ